MNRFAALIDRLSLETSRPARVRLLSDYLATTPDPDRGLALAVLTGGLSLRRAGPALARSLAADRMDPVLFALSHDYVGDLAETVALLWPEPAMSGKDCSTAPVLPPPLSEIVETLRDVRRASLPQQLAVWLDRLDAGGRRALLKLVTGPMRGGISACLARAAVATVGNRTPRQIEQVWHGLKPPYRELFEWIEGRAGPPVPCDPATFHPPMPVQDVAQAEIEAFAPADYLAGWKWAGVRVQLAAGHDAGNRYLVRLFSRTGHEISSLFPDLLETVTPEPFGAAVLDGELLIAIDGSVQPFGALRQRLDRRTVSPRLISAAPAHMRVDDLLALDGEDLRLLPFAERRARLEAFMPGRAPPRLGLAPLIPFASWDELAAARLDPAEAGAGRDAHAVEGVMLARRDGVCAPGGRRDSWRLWKRDPLSVDAVLMYARRGPGRQRAPCWDITFGVWRSSELVPVGKTIVDAPDTGHAEIDSFVRDNTIDRFGPVREVRNGADTGLVLQILFEGVDRSARHKSGLTLRLPRLAGIRHDRAPRDAGRLDDLLARTDA